jgi:lycopene beta-cyclase
MMKMAQSHAPTDYDYVIAGAGVSGLCLAEALTREFPDCTVLIIDPNEDPDYNISFWIEGETPFPDIMTHTWRQIAVRYSAALQVCPLERYHLHAFWRADFDAHLHRLLTQTGRVDFLNAPVSQIADCGDSVEVVTPRRFIRAGWAFDSRSKLVADARKHDPNLLLMEGLAWEIRTCQPAFDPDTATLFDFVQETPHFDFLYILPYTEQTALVNYAVIAPYKAGITQEQFARAIDHYLAQQAGIGDYEIVKACYGRIPLSARQTPRQTSGRVMNIGARGGMIKPSTSYAFARIVQDTRQIVHSLRATGQPFTSDVRPWYYQLADRRMVGVFRKHPALAQRVMFSMFAAGDGDSVLAFLDEKSGLRDNMRLFRQMPKPLLLRFLAALLIS